MVHFYRSSQCDFLLILARLDPVRNVGMEHIVSVYMYIHIYIYIYRGAPDSEAHLYGWINSSVRMIHIWGSCLRFDIRFDVN